MSFGKNRMHSTLATPALPAGHPEGTPGRCRDGVAGGAREYALSLDTQSDIYAPKWRPQLMQLICSLPDETRRCMQQELELLDQVQEQIRRLEARILERVQMTPTIQLIQSVPGPAKILSIVIDREVGSIDRFPSPHHFASYSGLVPKVKASGGKVHYGRMITPSRFPPGKQANNYLKWAFRAASRSIPMGSRSAAEGHRSRKRHCPSAAPSGVAGEARGPDLRTLSPTQGPLSRGRRRSKIPRRGDLLGPQEGRALQGARCQAACRQKVSGLVQAGAGACLTWILRDP